MTTYYAEDGKVFARTADGTREVKTAPEGERDRARFERALTIARTQVPLCVFCGSREHEAESCPKRTTPTTTEIIAIGVVSIAEIAELTGLAMRTIYAYRQSGKLPAPDYELGVGPVWKRETIEQWNAERNRRPGPPEELLSQWRESKTGAA